MLRPAAIGDVVSSVESQPVSCKLTAATPLGPPAWRLRSEGDQGLQRRINRRQRLGRLLLKQDLGLCECEGPLALNLDVAELPKGATLMICPIGFTAKAKPTGLLGALYDRPSSAALPEPMPAGNALAARKLLQRRQREQLMLLARRLVLASMTDNTPPLADPATAQNNAPVTTDTSDC